MDSEGFGSLWFRVSGFRGSGFRVSGSRVSGFTLSRFNILQGFIKATVPRGHIPRTAKGLHQASKERPQTVSPKPGFKVFELATGRAFNSTACCKRAVKMLRSGKPLDVCVETVEVGTWGF